LWVGLGPSRSMLVLSLSKRGIPIGRETIDMRFTGIRLSILMALAGAHIPAGQEKATMVMRHRTPKISPDVSHPTLMLVHLIPARISPAACHPTPMLVHLIRARISPAACHLILMVARPSQAAFHPTLTAILTLLVG